MHYELCIMNYFLLFHSLIMNYFVFLHHETYNSNISADVCRFGFHQFERPG